MHHAIWSDYAKSANAAKLPFGAMRISHLGMREGFDVDCPTGSI
jgi:hypothetical protein